MRKLFKNQRGRVSKGILSLVLAISMFLAVLTPVRAMADEGQRTEALSENAAVDAAENSRTEAAEGSQTTDDEVETPKGVVNAKKASFAAAGSFIAALALVGAGAMAAGVAFSRRRYRN